MKWLIEKYIRLLWDSNFKNEVELKFVSRTIRTAEGTILAVAAELFPKLALGSYPCFIYILLTAPCIYADNNFIGKQSDEPIEITSNRMEAFNEKNWLYFPVMQ